jgi:hypothetical protein
MRFLAEVCQAIEQTFSAGAIHGAPNYVATDMPTHMNSSLALSDTLFTNLLRTSGLTKAPTRLDICAV